MTHDPATLADRVEPNPDESTVTPEFARRMAPRNPAGGGPWCALCGIRMIEAGPGCPWSDCPHKTRQP